MSQTLGESPCAEFLRLQEEASLARRRFQLYKARTYGPSVTDPAFLLELERAFLLAENRLRRANPATHLSLVSDRVKSTLVAMPSRRERPADRLADRP